MSAAEWLLAAAVSVAIDLRLFRIPFECTLKPKWSTLVTGAPWSIAGGLIVVGVLRRLLGKPQLPRFIRLIAWLTLFLGGPLFLSGHICG